MKISRPVRELYEDLLPEYEKLKGLVDALLASKKQSRWHYESRLKGEESFALKLETGRVPDSRQPDDLFACTLVVENHSRIADAEELVCSLFELNQRRPRNAADTHLSPENFGFDDLRLYVKWKDDPTLPATGVDGRLFELQIKTFLQHAWGIATHDVVYKTDDVDWAGARIAFQVKAMLENAELSIGEAKRLTAANVVHRSDRAHAELRQTIQDIKQRWDADRLPTDLKRLAENFLNVADLLRLRLDDMWAAVDEATENGYGAKAVDFSPYCALIHALIAKHGARVFKPLEKNRRKFGLFVPAEIELPEVNDKTAKKIVRPSLSSTEVKGG